MARFDFQSPGAAFTAQIADTLAQRKSDERQALLDQLTMNADSRAQEAAQRDADFQKQQLANMQFTQNMQKLGMLTQNMRRGDDPLSRGVAPELFEFGRQLGTFEQMPRPEVTTSEGVYSEAPVGVDGAPAPVAPGPAPAPRWGFVGDRSEREDLERAAGSNKVIESMLADPNRRAEAEALKYAALVNRGILTPEVTARYTQPDVPVEVFDMDTGQLRSAGTTSPFAQILTRTRPPREYKPRNLMPIVDANGNLSMVDQDSIPIDPNTGLAKLPPGYSVPGRNGSGGGAHPLSALGLQQGFMDDVTLADRQLADPRSVTPAAIAGYRSTMGLAFQNAQIKASPLVRSLATEYLLNPRATQAKVAQMDLSEKDMNDLNTMINAVSPTAKYVLAENPFEPPKPKQSWSEFFWGK